MSLFVSVRVNNPNAIQQLGSGGSPRGAGTHGEGTTGTSSGVDIPVDSIPSPSRIEVKVRLMVKMDMTNAALMGANRAIAEAFKTAIHTTREDAKSAAEGAAVSSEAEAVIIMKTADEVFKKQMISIAIEAAVTVAAAVITAAAVVATQGAALMLAPAIFAALQGLGNIGVKVIQAEISYINSQGEAAQKVQQAVGQRLQYSQQSFASFLEQFIQGFTSTLENANTISRSIHTAP